MHSAVEAKRGKVLCFGPYRLETPTGLLLLQDYVVQIPPRALAVLRLLVEENGALVTKEDLIEKVWAGAFIEESNITKSIAEIRRILRPGFKDEDPIRTIWKQGYRLAVPVTIETVEEPCGAGASACPPSRSIPPGRTVFEAHWFRPAAVLAIGCLVVAIFSAFRSSPASASHQKVAVLGIRSLSNEHSSDWLATAITETLTSELQNGAAVRAVPAERVSQMRHDLGLASGNPYNLATLQKVQANLGCQLVVSGTVLALGDSLRLDLHVNDALTGDPRGTVSETGSAAGLFELVARTGAKLRTILGDQPAASPALPSAPVNTEALRLYAEGMDRLRTWDAQGAQELLTKALRSADNYAPIHAGLSLNWTQLGFDQRAREEARRALDTASQLPREQQLQIEALFAEASADWPKAIETWRALCRFYPDQTDYAERLSAALTIGGKAAEAAALLQNIRNPESRLLLASARASFALSDFAGTARTATLVIDQARKLSARLMESRALELRGEAFRRLSEFDKARDDFREAGRISSALGDRSGYAETLYSDAAVARMRKEANVEDLLGQALEIAGAVGNRHLARRILSELSNAHRGRADMEGALEFSKQALAVARESGDANGEAAVLIDIGNLLNNTGNPGQARDRYNEALARGRETGNRRVLSMALGNIGVLDLFSGDLTSATSRFQEALALKQQIGDRDSIAYTLIFLGRVSTVAGNLAEARRYLQEADTLLKSIDELSIAPVIQLARLDIIEGHPEKAEQPLLALAAKFDKPAPACEVYFLLAESWLARGNLDKAREFSARALALAAKTPNRADFGIPANLVAARIEMASGNYDKARRQMDSLLAESRKLGHVPLELSTRYALVCLQKNQGNLRAASETGKALQRDAERMGFGLIASSTQRVDTLAILRPPS